MEEKTLVVTLTIKISVYFGLYPCPACYFEYLRYCCQHVLSF